MSCPFYGMSHVYFWSAGKLFSSGGNECALINDRFAPCQMERAGLAPNWPTCPLNTQLSLPAPDQPAAAADGGKETSGASA